jgi:hypothetical protein
MRATGHLTPVNSPRRHPTVRARDSIPQADRLADTWLGQMRNGGWYEGDAVDRIRVTDPLAGVPMAGPGCRVTTDRGAGSGDPKTGLIFLTGYC